MTPNQLAELDLYLERIHEVHGPVKLRNEGATWREWEAIIPGGTKDLLFRTDNPTGAALIIGALKADARARGATIEHKDWLYDNNTRTYDAIINTDEQQTILEYHELEVIAYCKTWLAAFAVEVMES